MMQQLSRNILSQVNTNLVSVPNTKLFQLPETVLQFGTGVLLRGLIDQYIHAANMNGDYNGRVVVVKSTDTPGADAFSLQDGLYTDYMRGIAHGVRTEQLTINAAISRVLNAASDWNNILSVAASPSLEIIVSNTTEAGLVYDATDLILNNRVPKTFPGKLLACLFYRWNSLGSQANGLVILPTELVTENGRILKKMLQDLAQVQDLPPAFVEWLINENDFCNTLVDRIVPGKLSEEEMSSVQKMVGYDDALLLVREPFGLWAIETNRVSTKQKLGFARTPGNNIIVQDDITTFRELKLRLLNGTHSFTCALALMLGCATVKQAMEHPLCFAYLNRLMRDDITQYLVIKGIKLELINAFIDAVQDRFKNPFIDHQWVSISMNYTEKMGMRNIPLINQLMLQNGFVPETMLYGFAAFLWLNMTAQTNQNNMQVAQCTATPFELRDQYATILAKHSQESIPTYLRRVLSDDKIWNTNLFQINGFADQLEEILNALQSKSIQDLLNQRMTKALL